MSHPKRVAAPQVAPQLYDHIRALLRAGKNDQAIAKACAIGVILPDDLLAKELLFNGFFEKRDWLPALAVAKDLVHRQPNVARPESCLSRRYQTSSAMTRLLHRLSNTSRNMAKTRRS